MRGPGAEVARWPEDAGAQADVARRAAEVLRRGGLVVYPTDTVYGLGANPADGRAVQRIYEVKRRPDAKAIIWLAATMADVRAWCEVSRAAEDLAARFWPGGLTLILPRLHPGPDDIPTLGVRVPAHPASLAVIRGFGAAVATTSANRSGEPSARSAEEAIAAIGDDVDLVVDAGPSPGGVESTVLDLTVEPPLILRAGAVTQETIETALGKEIAVP
jgi:L-threonylcarbamoyladenylate synthase